MELLLATYENQPKMNEVIDFAGIQHDMNLLKQGPHYDFDWEILMHIPELMEMMWMYIGEYAPMITAVLGGHLVQGTP